MKESEGHLPPPSGCWVHSLWGYFVTELKKWGFKTTKIKCIKSHQKKEKENGMGQRSRWGQHEVRVRRGVRRRKRRAARLQMTCPEKHRQGQIHRKCKQSPPKDIQSTNISLTEARGHALNPAGSRERPWWVLVTRGDCETSSSTDVGRLCLLPD